MLRSRWCRRDGTGCNWPKTRITFITTTESSMRGSLRTTLLGPVLREAREWIEAASNMSGAPELIAIELDDHYANHVGHMADGTQFFLTTPFVAPTETDPGQDFTALFLFEKDGRFREVRIDAFGPRATADEARWGAVYKQRIAAWESLIMDGSRCDRSRSNALVWCSD